jgi:hypothetical protein
VALGRRRFPAASFLRAAAVALALVAAGGPHLLRPTERPRVTLTADEEPSLARNVALALAGRDPEADARLLADVGDLPGGEAAAVEALRVDLPVLVRRRPSPAAVTVPADLPWLEGIVLPPSATAGEPFVPRPRLSRSEPGTEVTLAVDGLEPFPWPEALTLAAGNHLLVARCRDAAGVDRGSVTATISIPGPPAVLLVEEGPPSPFARALEVQGLPVARRPDLPADLSPYAVLVLGAGAGGSPALEPAVRNGKGLLVLGARDDGRGLGRLRGSPVERALPVFLAPPLPPRPPTPDPLPPADPEPPPPGRGPELKTVEGDRPGAVVTLLLVVDTSGSMSGLKLEMARRAAAAAAATLAKVDRFGLLSFSEAPRWEIPLGPAGDAARIGESLRGLRAGGGTDLLPALRMARLALRRETTAVRHCVVLSDGETSPFGLHKVVEEMVADGATLSTVGVGADFDARLLGNLSSWGKGRTFPAVDPETLPRVVTLDTERVVAAGKEALAKARPAPDLPTPPSDVPPPKPSPGGSPPEPAPRVALEAADPCALLEGLGAWPAAVPPEAAPEARQATTLALRFAGAGGPALVLGRHGLGRTAVLSFDPADLAAWEGFPPAMARLVRGLAAAGPGPAVELLGATPGVEGTRVSFEVRGGGEGPLPPPRVEALHPSGDSPSAVPVEREGARRFAALLPPGKPGARTLVVRTGGAGDPGVPLAWFDRGPAPAAPPDPTRAARIARAAGATYVEGDLPPFPPARPGRPERVPVGLPLVVAAALLFLADTVLRRRP